MLLINKGNSIGWSYEELRVSKDALGINLISVLSSIEMSWDQNNNNGQKELSPKYKGLVKEAYNAMYHDIHGLAVQVDLLKFLFIHKGDLVRHKDFLFVSEIVEKYLTNLRSIYDFMAKVLRLSVEDRHLGQINFDSLNSLIESVEKEKTKGKISRELEELLISIKKEFHKVRNLRDSIVHNGEQITILTDEKGYLIEVLSEESNGKNTVYLMDFLSVRTKKMILFGEGIAEIVFKEYCKQYGDVTLFLVGLEGVCIPAFIEFLNMSYPFE